MQVTINIVEVEGPAINDCRNIGSVPDELGGRDLIFRADKGGMVRIYDYDTGEHIISAPGWDRTMQALADHCAAPVVVACDPGIGGGATSRMVGTWTPGATRPAATETPAATFPKLTKAQATTLRAVAADDVTYKPGREWAAPSDRTRYSFAVRRPKPYGSSRSVCTKSADALMDLELIDVESNARPCKTFLTDAGRAWLAAHPV